MHKYHFRHIQLFFPSALVVSLGLYFFVADNQDISLLVSAVLLFIFTITHRISYKTLIKAAAILLILACAFKALDLLVAASMIISLSFVVFTLAVIKIFLKRVVMLYGNPKITLYF